MSKKPSPPGVGDSIMLVLFHNNCAISIHQVPVEVQCQGRSRCPVESLVGLCSLLPRPEYAIQPLLISSAMLIYPVVKHVDEGGVVVYSLPHHRLSQPFPVELNRLTIRTNDRRSSAPHGVGTSGRELWRELWDMLMSSSSSPSSSSMVVGWGP